MTNLIKIVVSAILLASVATIAGAQGYGGYGGGYYIDPLSGSIVSPAGGGGGGGSYTSTPTTTSTTVGQVLGASTTAATMTDTSTKFKFNINMKKASKISDVKKLQDVLIAEGFLAAGMNTGNFGNLTLAAVKAYQAKNNVQATGFVGPLTRAVLNK